MVEGAAVKSEDGRSGEINKYDIGHGWVCFLGFHPSLEMTIGDYNYRVIQIYSCPAPPSWKGLEEWKMFFHFHWYQFPEGYLQAAPRSEVYEAARNWFIKPVISILAFRYERRFWRYFKRNIAGHFTLTHRLSRRQVFCVEYIAMGACKSFVFCKWTLLLYPQPIRCGWFGPYYQGRVYTLKQLRLVIN